MKLRSIILFACLFVLLSSSIVFGATNIGSFSFSISPSQYRSNTQPWQARSSAQKNEVYINTMARVTNVGAEDTYYLVALTATGSGCAKVLANGSQVRRSMNSYAFTNGTSYGGFAWRYDSTLNTNIVDGFVLILK